MPSFSVNNNGKALLLNKRQQVEQPITIMKLEDYDVKRRRQITGYPSVYVSKVTFKLLEIWKQAKFGDGNNEDSFIFR